MASVPVSKRTVPPPVNSVSAPDVLTARTQPIPLGSNQNNLSLVVDLGGVGEVDIAALADLQRSVIRQWSVQEQVAGKVNGLTVSQRTQSRRYLQQTSIHCLRGYSEVAAAYIDISRIRQGLCGQIIAIGSVETQRAIA